MDNLKKEIHERNFGDLSLQANKLSSYPMQIAREDTSIIRLQMIANHSPVNDENDDILLGVGTGFLVTLNNDKTLITCWHNVTGIHHETREWISDKKASQTSPTHIIAQNTFISPKGNGFNKQRYALYDSVGTPKWRVHPAVKNFYDIVAIDLIDDDAPQLCPAVKIQKDSLLRSIRPRQEIFVAGYPTHDASNQFLPIWKKGSIASSPQLPYAGHPKFLIDATTRGGMSGAPVFFHNQSTMKHFPYNGGDGYGELSGPLLWVGMYTAREYTSDSSNSSELGFVWRKDDIIDVIEKGVRDCSPELGISYPAYKYKP